MEQTIEIPKVKKVLYESVWVRGTQRTVTKVHFKGGSVITFQGPLDRPEAIRQAYLHRGIDAGMTMEDAEAFADTRAGK